VCVHERERVCVSVCACVCVCVCFLFENIIHGPVGLNGLNKTIGNK